MAWIDDYMKKRGIKPQGGAAPANSRAQAQLEAQRQEMNRSKAGGNTSSGNKLLEKARAAAPTLPNIKTQVVLGQPAPQAKAATLPIYSGRLSGHGMPSEEKPSEHYAIKYANAAKRMDAGAASIGYGFAGTLPALGETAWQQWKNMQADRATAADQALYGERMQADLAEREKLRQARTATPVDQSLFGQRMMAMSRAKQEEATRGLTGVDAFLANTAISMGANAPAIAIGVASPAAGLGLMGTLAAAHKTTELSERGYAPGEALGRGLLSGAIEVVTERLPLEHLASIVKGSTGRSAVKNLLRQVGMEGTEEAIAYVANYVADKAAKDPQAQFSLAEMAQEALGGMVSGGVFSSIGTAVSGAIGAGKEPRLPNMGRAQETAQAAPAQNKPSGPLALPPSKLFVSPDGQVTTDLPRENQPLNTRKYIERTGERVAENADEFSFNTLTDEQVHNVNRLIRAAQENNTTAAEYLSRIAKPMDGIVEKAIDDLTAELQSYQAQGVTINQANGTRISNNEKWYSDFYRESGRAPNKAERAEIAKRLVMDDVAKERGHYVPADAARGYNLAGEFRHALSKVDPDTVHVRNEGDRTVIERGRVRQEVVPTYSPVNAKQIIQRVQETAREHNIPQETADTISKIAGRFDARVEFVDSLGDRINGKYEKGVITIARDTENPVMAVFTHELTHHIESSGQYEELANLVRGHIVDGGKDFNVLVEKQKELYGKEGIQLDDAGAEREVVARYLEDKGLFDDAFIERITQENPSLARQILNWIKDTIRKIGADADTKFLIDAQRMYEKAAREGNASTVNKQSMQKGGKDAQFSISLDSEGNKLSTEQVEFFKDSKVRDDDGNLKVVYHGTDADFTVFDRAKTRANMDIQGNFFSPWEVDAGGYGGKTRRYFLNITNPASESAGYSALKKFQGQNNAGVKARDHLVDLGYDGVNNGGEEYIAFNPEQIKSVDNKNPTDDPDIRYSRSDEMSDFMKEYLGQYGAIKKGESPARDVSVPKETKHGKTRKFTRTMMESEAIPDSMVGDFEEAILNGTFSYAPISDKVALGMAERTIRDKGFDGALEQWKSVSGGKKHATKHDIVLGEMLLNQAANAGDVKLAMDLAAELAAEGTRAGQSVQALRLLKRMKPDGQLYYLQKSVQKINADLLDRLKLKAPNVKINEGLASELLNAKSQGEMDAATDKIMQNIADQIPPTWLDKWNAWRYLSMLGNPRTHIRNIIGNATFMPAVKLKNLIGTAMEARLPQDQRTKAVLTAKDKGLRDFARADFETVRDEITSGGKLNPSDAIRDKQTIFKTKWLEWARKMNLNALEAEDAIFLKAHYATSMAQFMKVRGYTAETIKGSPKTLEEARNYAIHEAQKATYRDASKAATAINNFKRSGPVQGVIGEGIMPFTKTPINLLKRGIEYSPVGLINGTKSALVDVKGGKITASQAIDQLASGLSGTAITVLGMWLASLGLLSGGDSDDKKESMFDRLQGLQNYAIKIGDYSYTLDWAAPSSLPLFVGVEIYNMSQGETWGGSLSNILDGLSKISEPMVEMSMLQGLQNAFSAASYGESPLTAVIVETASGYFGQAVPTLAGQVARTIDGTRRTRYIDKNEGHLPEVVQKFAQKQQAKLPGASKAMLPYVDAWGRTQESGNMGGRALQNFLSPGYLSKNKKEAVDAELERLYKSTGEGKVLPSNAKQFMYFDGETKRFTATEYYDYAVERGKVAHDALKALVDSPTYKGLSDDERVNVVSSLYDYANGVAKTKVSDYELPKQLKGAQMVQKQGVPLGDYFTAYHAQKEVEGEPDGSGGTISGTETVNKRRAIDAVMSGTNFDQRDLVYKAFNVGLSEAAEKKWSVPSVQKAVGSKENYYKVQEIISTIQADKDEYGNSISGTTKAKEIAAISETLGVSKEKAGGIYNELVLFKHSISEMTSKQQRGYAELKQSGMSEERYIKCINAIKLASGIKGANGKTIRGTYKQDQIRRLIGAGLSPAQANHFYQVVVK